MKPMRRTDRKLLDTYHAKRCAACGRTPCDPAHIQSVGAGGPDESWNVIPLCRVHHTEQHAKGWSYMATRYMNVGYYLKLEGWAFDSFHKLKRELAVK